jgi:hypothetical protein
MSEYISAAIIGLFIMFCIAGIYNDIKQQKHGVQIENIKARILLLSDDSKEISNFLITKEPYIAKDLIEQLINRLAELKADEVIVKDWSNKTESESPAIEEDLEQIKKVEKI